MSVNLSEKTESLSAAEKATILNNWDNGDTEQFPMPNQQRILRDLVIAVKQLSERINKLEGK